MHISRLRLRNFRNFQKAEFRFTGGVNTLIGENGSGKTNAFQAMRLLLDDSLSRGAIGLRESDFNRSLKSWKGSWIVISLDFDELDASEGCQVMRHGVGHMNDTNSGTYTLLFRPNKVIRKTLFELSKKNNTRAEIEQTLDDLTVDQYESVFTGRGTADFLDDTVFESLVGDFDELKFPDPEDDASLVGDRIFQPLHREVSCTFVKALRDVLSDLRNYRDSPLLNLLRGAEGKISINEATTILAQISTLNSEISGLQEIRDIAQGVQDSLRDTVGHTYSPTIDIRSAIPEELDRLLQRLCLTVCDPGDEGYKGELEELSLGGANLIYLSLKLLEYELKTASDRVAHFLLIEEPESHIHTHIQKTLFEKYNYENTQVIVSTHSTHISAASKISSVNILAKSGCESKVFHPANGLNQSDCHRIERYLDAVRTTLLFAKGVILVEGDAEMILIPALTKKVLGLSLDELGVLALTYTNRAADEIAEVLKHQRDAKTQRDAMERAIVDLTDQGGEVLEQLVEIKKRSSRASSSSGGGVFDKIGGEVSKPFRRFGKAVKAEVGNLTKENIERWVRDPAEIMQKQYDAGRVNFKVEINRGVEAAKSSWWYQKLVVAGKHLLLEDPGPNMETIEPAFAPTGLPFARPEYDSSKPVYFMNGVGNTRKQARAHAQFLADLQNVQVKFIYNHSFLQPPGTTWAPGNVSISYGFDDISETIYDKFWPVAVLAAPISVRALFVSRGRVQENPAARFLAHEIYNELGEGRDVRLVVHSQATLICRNALLACLCLRGDVSKVSCVLAAPALSAAEMVASDTLSNLTYIVNRRDAIAPLLAHRATVKGLLETIGKSANEHDFSNNREPYGGKTAFGKATYVRMIRPEHLKASDSKGKTVHS